MPAKVHRSQPALEPGLPEVLGVRDEDDRDQTAALEPGESFDAVVLPHLDVARRLARWLMRDEQDAEDVVQEASLRAFRYFRTFGGGNGRAWFLRIVRNTCYGWRRADCQPRPTRSMKSSTARPITSGSGNVAAANR